MSRSPRLRLASLFVFGFLPLLTVASTSTVADGGARRNVSSLVFPPNVRHLFLTVGDQPLKTLGVHASPHRISHGGE